MVFNDLVCLELIILFVAIFYILSANLITLFYAAGLYLITVGLFSFLNDTDIYIGFLWVIDLGVGLVFFIFIIHFTAFLHQKAHILISARHFIISYAFIAYAIIVFYFMPLSVDTTFYGDLSKTWAFRITYMDYYLIFFACEVTDLNTLKTTYFFLNSFEFFLVNFSLLFGLICAILLCFLVQRIFSFLNFSQIFNFSLYQISNSGFFLRNQNFLTQLNTFASARVWAKK